MNRTLIAKLLALTSFLALISASEANAACINVPGSSQCLPVVILVDPATGNPVGAPSFSLSATMTTGTVYVAGRSIGVNATAAGSIILTLAGGGTITLPVVVGWQTFPFAATEFTFSGGAAGVVSKLN